MLGLDGLFPAPDPNRFDGHGAPTHLRALPAPVRPVGPRGKRSTVVLPGSGLSYTTGSRSRATHVAVLLLVLLLLAFALFAQSTPPLPKALRGRLVWLAGGAWATTYTDKLSVVLDEPTAGGKVTGRLTVQGIWCGGPR